MKIGVTGGSGVVGRALIRHLVGEGHQVSALTRTPVSAAELAGLGATPVDGDVIDPPGLLPLVEGKDWVFHVAGINEMCSPDPDLMDLVNIQGTRNVMEACRLAGVGRMIHTSSAAAIGEAHGTIGSEASRHRGSYLSRYERSKHLSEQLVLEEAGDLDVVVVNPSSVQGPGRATGTGKLILDLLNGTLQFLVETTVSIVDIDDCARGHVLAAERRSHRPAVHPQRLQLLDIQAGRPVQPGHRAKPGTEIPARLGGDGSSTCPRARGADHESAPTGLS